MKKGILILISSLMISLFSFAQTHSVTFQVHNPSTTPVYVFGNWSGWSNWPGDVMTSIGNNTYAVTLQLNGNATYEFLYVNGVAPAKETLNPAWTCTNGNAQYTNRVLSLGSQNTTVCYEWGSCTSCGGAVLTQVDLPVTFDNSNVNYLFSDFGGNASVIHADPVVPTNMVCKTIKTGSAELWAGTTISGGGTAGFATAIPFTANSTKISMRVFSPDAGIPVRMKVEDPNDYTKCVETEAMTTVANTWETLEFNFANQAPGTAAINLGYIYKKLSVFFNFGTTGAVAGEKTYYFDDISFGGAPVVLNQVNLPVTFDATNIDYALVDFGGNASVIQADPVVPTNMVCKTIKTGSAELWAGTTIGGTAGFATVIPFTANATKITMRVYSPNAGIPVRMKVEDPNDPTKSVETEAMTTVANAWETLEFNFANQATGTAAINFSYIYKKLSVFFNFGTTGAVAGEKTYYFDDVTFGGGSVVLNQVNLPVTFDNTNINYALVDFGGNASVIQADPVVPTNLVCKTIKGNTAELWAGTTIGGTTGFATAIPFAANATKITMRVYSANAGIPVRLKAEDATDPTKSVETEAMTTVANAWETLDFNFANQATGTAAINFGYTYKKLSVFFNFGTTGAVAGEKTYYFDDVQFGAVTPSTTSVTFKVHNPQSTPVFVYGSWSNWANWPGELMADIGNNTYQATVQLTTGTVYEYLYVNGDPFTKEVLDPSWACTNANTQYTNRVMTAAGATMELCNNWASCDACGSSGLTQVNLPVTFDNTNVAYELVDFGGNASVIMADPANPSNMVTQTIKGNTAELWAGTTIGGTAGFSTAIPFAAGATTMSMRVYSPDAGIKVRMKVEDPNDPTKSVETEATTATSNAWETLTFNFANQAPGTAVINYGYTFKKLSVFFNFGVTGAAAGTKTYYFDDIQFGNAAPTTTNVTFRVHNPQTTPVYAFGSWGGWVNFPGNLMTSVGNNTYEVTIQLNTSTIYEYLYVNGNEPVKEVLDPTWLCTNGNSQYTNRIFTTGTSSSTMCSDWGSCATCDGVNISGTVSYFNSLASAMSNTSVYLCHGTDTLGTTTTNADGQYAFANKPAGLYTLKTKTTKAWGGGNATDALLILKHFVGSAIQTGLALTACDVDASTFTNAADALSVMKRFVGLQNAFPSGDWAYTHPTVSTLSGVNATQNINALCFGDINGSFIPEAKTEAGISIKNQGLAVCSANGIFEIPVKLNVSSPASALSLNLEYSTSDFEILEIIPSAKMQSNENSMFMANNTAGNLQLAWLSLSQTIGTDDAVLFTLKVKMLNKKTPEFTIGSSSNCSDISGNDLQNSNLIIPSFSQNTTESSLSFCSPNPFTNALSVNVNVPEKGMLKVKISSVQGQDILVVNESVLESGVHQFVQDLSQLKSGMYLLITEFEGSTSKLTKIEKILKN